MLLSANEYYCCCGHTSQLIQTTFVDLILRYAKKESFTDRANILAV